MSKPIKGILGESSPKRRVGRRSLQTSMVEKSTSTAITNHLDIGHYELEKPGTSPEYDSREDEWEDEEVYNSSRLSPIGAEAKGLHELEKVSSYTPQNRQHTTPKDTKIKNDERYLETDITEKSEADDTILKVKKFIEGKRKDLDNKRKSLSPKKTEKVDQSASSKPNDAERRQKIDVRKINKQKRHRKVLQRLIHKIHEEPYDSQWSIVEWQLFQHYLNEWKLSGDDNMFNDEVLKDLFNCSVEELEVRIKSLKKLLDYKRKIKKACT